MAGLRAVGADPAQAASRLLALTLVFGVGVLWLSWQSRVPVTLAWSIPGAALLAGSGTVDGGWSAAVGAFLVTGVLIALTGLVPLAVIGILLAVSGIGIPHDTLLPALVRTTPAFSLEAVAGIAVPPFIVTMASQNIPGVAVLKSFGFEAPWRPSMLVTGPDRRLRPQLRRHRGRVLGAGSRARGPLGA